MIRHAAFLLLAFCLGACHADEQKPKAVSANAAYDHVMATQTIRCGYVTYPPSFVRDPNTGAFSGIFYDLTQELGRRLNLKIEMAEEVTWGTYIEGLKSGRYDMICSGAWSDAMEGREVGYSRALFYSPFYAYVRASDNRFDDDITKLNDPQVVFSVGDGTMASIIARSDFPKAKQASLPQMSDESLLIMNVATGKADATLVEPHVAAQYAKNNPDKIKSLEPQKPVRVFPNRYVLPLGDVKMQSMVDAALEEMLNDGTVDRLLAKYEIFPGSFLRVARPYRDGP